LSSSVPATEVPPNFITTIPSVVCLVVIEHPSIGEL
jgi:hypothetical protein